MITRRAWEVLWGIDRGKYNFPNRTKHNIKKLVDKEMGLIVSLGISFIYLVSTMIQWDQINQSRTTIIISVACLTLLFLAIVMYWNQRRQRLKIWHRLLSATKFAEKIPGINYSLEDFGKLGAEDLHSQIILIEMNLKRRALNYYNLKRGAKTEEQRKEAWEAHNDFLNFFSDCFMVGLNEKSPYEFFPKGTKNI